MVTLKDIAEKTGYSVNTVSVALNRNGRISKETKELICKCAEEMGYIPNTSAQRMRTGKSGLIAVIVDDLVNPRLSRLVDGIILYASYHEYSVISYTTYGDINKLNKSIHSAIARNVDGILISPIDGSEESIQLIRRSKIPYVLIGREIDEFGGDLSVTYDDIRAGFIAAEHLAINGHKKIAFLNSEENILNGNLRVKGIQAAIQMYGGNLKDDKIFNIPLNIHNRSAYFNDIAIKLDDVSAVICYDNFIAFEFIAALKSVNKSVPEDISVMGFGKVNMNFGLLPNLSTVMAEDSVLPIEAVTVLLKMIAGEETEKKLIPVSLVEGDTVKQIV